MNRAICLCCLVDSERFIEKTRTFSPIPPLPRVRYPESRVFRPESRLLPRRPAQTIVGNDFSDVGIQSSDVGICASDIGIRVSDDGIRVSNVGILLSADGIPVSDDGNPFSDDGISISDDGFGIPEVIHSPIDGAARTTLPTSSSLD
jgi:hypothetical protein